MKNLKAILLALSALMFFAFPARTQVASFIRYSVENGMAQSQVQTAVQDDLGRIWIGTINGLSVYDGVRFVNYSKKDGLAEDWITCAYKDVEGNLWFGHLGGSISRYDIKAKTFEDVKIEAYNEFLTITSFATLDSANFIFSSTGSGLFSYNIKSRKVKKIAFSTADNAAFISKAFIDNYGNIWLGTEDNGVYVFNKKDIDKEQLEAENIAMNEDLSSNKISDITLFKDEVWIATKDQGINVINANEANAFINKQSKNLKIQKLNEKNLLISNYINCILTESDQYIWIGTNNRGVTRLENKDGKLYSKVYGVAQGLSFYSINNLFKDREQSIWIGTNVGLNQYISDYFLLFDESVGIVNNMIWSVMPDGKGNIWLGTNSGISVLNNADNSINDDEIEVSNLDIDGLNNAVNTMHRDKEGNLWFASTTGALFKRDTKGAFQRISVESVFRDVIFTIGEDLEGNIWVGTRAGAARIDKKSNKLKFFNFENGLAINNIRKIIGDNKGNVWFGGLGGIVKYDGENFTKIKVLDNDDALVVLSIAEDLSGNIWFGGYSVGLFKYNGDSIKQYNKENGMTSETPYAIVVDKDNNLWIGTSFGVEQYKQDNGQFLHFSKSEGFLGVEVNPNAICKDENENIWFGTILGAVKYNPNSDSYNEYPPIMKMEGLEVNLEPAEFPFDGEFLPQENDLTFKFIGIGLNNSNKINYEYFLEGFSSEWKKIGVREVFFSNLNPGSYVFKVRAYNGDGVVSEPLVYNFNIKIPFYESYWFYGIQVVIIILLLTLAVFYGRKTGGSRVATVLASIAIIIVFEYGVNYVEDNVEDVIGGVAFIKVGLNALLGFVLFPVENFIKGLIVRENE